MLIMCVCSCFLDAKSISKTWLRLDKTLDFRWGRKKQQKHKLKLKNTTFGACLPFKLLKCLYLTTSTAMAHIHIYKRIVLFCWSTQIIYNNNWKQIMPPEECDVLWLSSGLAWICLAWMAVQLHMLWLPSFNQHYAEARCDFLRPYT